ncbi:hypothetical protein ACHAW5_008069 [Stephanodiscus triporus]|uniref:Uncharacterized protein n=1 Tax=Stephanodiscus triporus TaxID=2934178 RepID=A0ABD3Q0A0_9STRA
MLDGNGTPSLEQRSCKYDMVLVERIQRRPPADADRGKTCPSFTCVELFPWGQDGRRKMAG